MYQTSILNNKHYSKIDDKRRNQLLSHTKLYSNIISNTAAGIFFNIHSGKVFRSLENKLIKSVTYTTIEIKWTLRQLPKGISKKNF